MRMALTVERGAAARWVVAAGLAVASMGGVATPTLAAPGASGEQIARSCPLINIGTPDRPRMVKDPACQSGR
ncbi:MAG: hypothetical protein ROR55_02440 [Devosia sp.]